VTDQELIDNLCLDRIKHDKALSYLYNSVKFKTPVYSFLRHKGVNSSDLTLLWTDICVKFALLVKNGKYEHKGKMLGYIKNLANFMALNYFRDLKREPPKQTLDGIQDDFQISYVANNHFELKRLLDQQLDKLGEVCKNLLLHWSRGYSMKEISTKFNIISETATRKRKHNCMKKLLSIVHADEKMAALLKEYYHELK